MRQLPAGTAVRIRRPGRLHGVTATVLRPVSGGYEVAFFSPRGRPLHAVLHPRWLQVVSFHEGPREDQRARRHAQVTPGSGR